MHIVHIQCLLRVDGSTLAGVFLTSSFCVVPESYSSNEASGILLVAWYTQTQVSTESTVHGFIPNFCTRGGHRTGGCSAPQTSMSLFQTDLDYSYPPCIKQFCNGVLRLNTLVTVYGGFFGEPISSPREMSTGFISLHAKPY